MREMRSIIRPKKSLHIIIIVACILTTMLGTVPMVYAADNDDVEYIYFDLSAGNVTINGSSYTGYVYQKNGDAFTTKTISGTFSSGQAYYVYQSYGGANAPDGYFDVATGTYIIPTRTPVTHNDKEWEDYITNNSNVEEVITAWITAASEAERISTPNTITIKGNLDATLIIDNLWSSDHKYGTSRTTGGISFIPGSNGSHLIIEAKGDNRFGNIFYHNKQNNTNTNLTFEEKEAGSSITVANLTPNDNKNYWCAAIGGNDSGQDAVAGLVFNGGTIFAGTNARDDCTAIGGGGNGYAKITINGGRVTAAVTSSGAAIGGGIGKTSNGGQADVYINGGEVYAYNFSCSSGGYSQQGVAYIPSAAIGGGSSARAQCNACTVTIMGGRVYAQSVGGTAIGGGSSADNNGGTATVTVGGNAYVEAKSIAGTINGQNVPAGVAIGGGTGGKADGKNGGNVTLTIKENPTVIVGSIGGGKTISPSGKIGSAKVTITGGTIQGQIIMAQGSSTNCSFDMSGGTIDNSKHDNSIFPFLEENGGVIYMDDSKGVANISGGTIIGSNAQNGGAIYMTAGAATISGTATIQNCSATTNGGAVYMGGGTLTMSGGTLSSNTAVNGAGAYLEAGEMTISGGTIIDNIATKNGGAAYLGGGDLIVSGGEITSNKAINGAGAYLANGTMTISGGTIVDNVAEQNGGAAYLNGGNLIVSGGEIISNDALNGAGAYLAKGSMEVSGGAIKDNPAVENGGAAYLAGGSFTMTNGTISGNTAQNGAGAFVADGEVTVSGGTIYKNTAKQNGGAFSITNGNYTMTGGTIDENYALSGDGGAIYISSSQNNTKIIIRSGSIVNNFAGNSGGALGVYGQDNVTFTITIGSNTNHADRTGSHECQDDPEKNESCPILENNNALTSGGGIYLSGSYLAVMNMYCIVEDNNNVGDRENVDTFGVSDSNFMKVEGGTLNITTNDGASNANYGNVVINSSVHVTGGKVAIVGSGSNPTFNEPVTVDVKDPTDFVDDRKGGTSRTIQYFENAPDGSGKYQLIDYPAEGDSHSHTVRSNVFEIPGYTSNGWRLMRLENGQYVDTGTVFPGGTICNEAGNLIFFADWEAIQYSIIFSNGITGTGAVTGSMEPQGFSFDNPTKNLALNKFKVKGQKFIVWTWVDAPDTVTKTTFNDGESFTWPTHLEITQIELVASWETCHHNDFEKYTFTKTEASATRVCQCEAYSEYIILQGITGVYKEGHRHEATVTHKPDSQEGAIPLWAFTVLYNGKSYGGNELNDSTDAPINAGNYTASVTVSHLDKTYTISVDVIVKKADRGQLPAIPQYDSVGNIITVQDPEDEPKDETRLTLEYLFSWYDGTQLETGEKWIRYNPYNTDNTDDILPSFEMDEAWTNYAVEVRYAETDNYNASVSVKSGTYLWTGKVQIKITVGGEGHLVYTRLDPDETVQGGGITITLVPKSSAYYIYNLKADINVTSENGAAVENYTNPNIVSKSIKADEWIVLIHNIEPSPFSDEDIIIEISFSGGEAKATTDTSIVKDEVFNSIGTNGENNITISRDSAYTVSFDVKNFNHYTNPAIQFSPAIPVGTTIIMVDPTDSSYWSYTAEAFTETLLLSDFVRMGSNQPFVLTDNRKAFVLQFIVDFSNCATTMGGNSIVTSFVASSEGMYKANYADVSINHVSEISVLATVGLTDVPNFLVDVTNKIVPGEEILSQTITYQFAYNPDKNVGVSKWNKLCGMLIITPIDGTVLPPDAGLEVKIGDVTNYYSFINGQFVVALPEVGAGNATITLLSKMLPDGAQDFTFSVELYASATKVRTTPDKFLQVSQNSLKYQTIVDPTIHVQIEGDLPVCNKADDGVSISSLAFSGYAVNIPENCHLRVLLYAKNANGGYTSTTVEMRNEETGLTITPADGNGKQTFTGVLQLTSFEEEMKQKVGSLSLRLNVEIVDGTGIVVKSVPLHFVLIDARQ